MLPPRQYMGHWAEVILVQILDLKRKKRMMTREISLLQIWWMEAENEWNVCPMLGTVLVTSPLYVVSLWHMGIISNLKAQKLKLRGLKWLAHSHSEDVAASLSTDHFTTPQQRRKHSKQHLFNEHLLCAGYNNVLEPTDQHYELRE